MSRKQDIINMDSYVCVNREGKRYNQETVLLKEHKITIFINEKDSFEIVCTNEYLDELVAGRILTEKKKCQKLQPIYYPNDWIFQMADRMAKGMPIHEKTWATHSCFLYKENELLFSCEDIGRHNAMDKVIGYGIRNQIDLTKCAIYSSGRVPSDMVMKVIKAGIPLLVSKGMPTEDAIRIAKKYKLTLICGARSDQMRVYADYRDYAE